MANTLVVVSKTLLELETTLETLENKGLSVGIGHISINPKLDRSVLDDIRKKNVVGNLAKIIVPSNFHVTNDVINQSEFKVIKLMDDGNFQRVSVV